MKKADISTIFDCYNLKLMGCHARNFKKPSNNMEYFVNYLKFMRDYYIINVNEQSSDIDKRNLATLIQTVLEYDQYLQSTAGYVSVLQDTPDNDKTEEQKAQLEKYIREKDEHWKKFWTLIMQNMEGWMVHDS